MRSLAGSAAFATAPAGWSGPVDSLEFEGDAIRRRLADLASPCFAVDYEGRVGVTSEGEITPPSDSGPELVAAVGSLPADRLGSAEFRRAHGVDLAYAAGAMANGVAGEELVAALGRKGILAAFGTAGLAPARVASAIDRVQSALPRGPFAFNLIHSPDATALEQALVELYLARRVRTVEASAFMQLTPAIVQYRVAGIEPGDDGAPAAANRVIAKVSRPEVARQFLSPPPAAMLTDLVSAGRVAAWQARAAAELPMADDVTAEADSAGHTDGQPLVLLLPAMIALRDELQSAERHRQPPRIGAAGGVATPSAAAAAFALGADYVVTGSINQSCVEAATSPAVKALLAQAAMTDVAMAPAADMFELGVQVQVLKRGTLFAMRARRLYDLFTSYDRLEAIPAPERARLQRELFRLPLDTVWEQTRAYFAQHDRELLERAESDPRLRMALTFRWYLGRSSEWAATGDPDRAADYQVWCGPAMGAFNAWAAGSPLADPAGRRADHVAWSLMSGAAQLMRAQALRAQGAVLPAEATQTGPVAPPAAPQPVAPPTREPAATPPTAEVIEQWFVAELAARLSIDPDSVDVHTEFGAFDISSVQALAILARLEQWLGRRLSQTLVWNYPTIAALAAHLGLDERGHDSVVA
jgi:trans-AT polyketide synthase/acyltransferase/oxidoreductase domain-containing protein